MAGARRSDALPLELAQWSDADRDGLGDVVGNRSLRPTLADACRPLVWINESFYMESDRACVHGWGNDGWNDTDQSDGRVDRFPDDATEWRDGDGGGIGDGADLGADGDASSDADEVDAGTRPLAAEDTPELVIGVDIPLGSRTLSLRGCDHMAGIVSLALSPFIATRKGRFVRFEAALEDTTTLQELADTSRGHEKSMVRRLLSPHQGFMPERIRSRREVES